MPLFRVPELAERAQAEFREARARWIRKAKQAAQPLFAQAKAILHEAGVPDDAVETQFSTAFDTQDVVADILEAARAGQCGTVVVGREIFSGFKGMFHQHVGDQLVPNGHGLTIWIVE